jgi:hypothetical protein
MTSNLKAILSAVGVAALLASPALAKTAHNHAAPSLANVPADAHASVVGPSRSAVTVYAPNVPQQAHETPGPNPDFQLGSEK